MLIGGVLTIFWKLALTKQYTFLASPDLANQVLPWLQVQVFAFRHWSIMLWDPHEWFGQSLIGQVQPAVASPFTILLALAPLHHGQIQVFYVHVWYVLIHCAAAIFMFSFCRDQGCAGGPAVLGGISYAATGFFGNTDWPQHLEAAIWTPLVFLFLLRTLRGRMPIKSAALAGAALGFSWLGGHHGPALVLTLAAAGTGAAALLESRFRREIVLRLSIASVVMALVAAVQILPAIEYGHLAKRWTGTGVLRWQDRVAFPEHENSSLRPTDLLHIVIPGGAGLFSDPFVGTVALSLAALSVGAGFQRRDIRLFLGLAAGSLLYAMARFDVFYGPLYALVPLVEKTREPIVAVSVFGFAVSTLAARGAQFMAAGEAVRHARAIGKSLVWFGSGTFGLFLLMTYLRPAVASAILDGDSRPGMIGLIALALAGVYYGCRRGYLSPNATLALIGVLLIVEQGNEVGNGWAHVRDADRMRQIAALTDTQDLADWLRTRPDPKRLDVNSKDIPFNFGDWYRIDAANAYTPSVPADTIDLGNWWNDRIGNMYGLNYILSRTATRPGLQEMFRGKTGIAIWYNPAAFPRAWIVHQIVAAPNRSAGADLVNSGRFDLRSAAVVVGSGPRLERCGGADTVNSIEEGSASGRVDVTVSCKGMLVLSDSWYPGWQAEVDGRPAAIWKVNTVIRGVVVGAGRHQIIMRYRPATVYLGLFCTILGLFLALILQSRNESDGPDCVCL